MAAFPAGTPHLFKKHEALSFKELILPDMVWKLLQLPCSLWEKGVGKPPGKEEGGQVAGLLWLFGPRGHGPATQILRASVK